MPGVRMIFEVEMPIGDHPTDTAVADVLAPCHGDLLRRSCVECKMRKTDNLSAEIDQVMGIAAAGDARRLLPGKDGGFFDRVRIEGAVLVNACRRYSGGVGITVCIGRSRSDRTGFDGIASSRC